MKFWSLNNKYLGIEEHKKCNIVVILNLDIIKDIPSYALADYWNEEPMKKS